MPRPPKPLLVLAICAALLAAGCAGAPRAELTRLQAAMATTRAAADPLFDDLAIAERRVGTTTTLAEARGAGAAGAPPTPSGCIARWTGERSTGFVGVLCPEHIPFESGIGDPPATASLRCGLAALTDATTALLALAENRNLDEARAQVEGLTGALSGFVQAAAAPFGPTSGAQAVLTLLGPVAAQLQPLIGQIVAANNAERVRRLILDDEQRFVALVRGLRGAVPAMNQMFVADFEQRIAFATPAQRAALVADGARTMNGYRRLLSDYARLLDGVDAAWVATVAAAREPERVDLAAINAALGEARTAAETVRRAQAAFRAGQ
jgi:hypothetical protein